MTVDLTTHTPNATIAPNDARGGLNVHLPLHSPQVSPQWQFGGLRLQFVGLPAGETLALDQSAGAVYLKVVSGSVDKDAGDGPAPCAAFPARGSVATTRTEGAAVTATSDAVLCLVTDTPQAPARIDHMDLLTVSGPMAEHLAWQSFEQKFGAFTEAFNGLDAHMVFGFHLLDATGEEIAYVHFWTTGKGVDVTTHNHGQDPSPLAPAFAEVHLVLRNGTGTGGMYECATQTATERERLPMQVGEEHGPFFFVDSDGAPRRRANGAVDYPWHGWQGGEDGQPGQAYDLVAAFEINPDYVRVKA